MVTEVRLFGSPSYRVSGEWRPLPLDKRGALLALLAHEQDGWQRPRLAQLFWPGATPAQGRVNLRGLLARVKAADARLRLSLHDEWVRWPVHCDSREFREAVSEERWLDAVASSKAPLLDLELPEFGEVGAWMSLERCELEAMYQAAAVHAAEQLAAAGHFQQVESLWRRALERDPYEQAAVDAALRLARRFPQLGAPALRVLQRFTVRLHADLGVPPPEDLRRLAQELRASAPGAANRPAGRTPVIPGSPTPARAPPTSRAATLPAPTVPLVQRDVELAEVVNLFTASAERCVTIVGAGGSGKTQLALQAARQLSRSGIGDVWFVPLSGITAGDLLIPTVAHAVGVQVQGSTPVGDQLMAYLRHRKALLVLDNLEQLPSSGGWIASVLSACEHLRVLGTSRAPLVGAAGEIYELQGMHYPADETDPNFVEYDAVRLFLLRLRQARPKFTLAATDLPALIAVCRAVGGAPLGIELAAAWTSLLTLPEIAEALEAGISVRDQELQDVPARHLSLRTAFEHSWRLLTADEQRALAALSVFAGGFTSEAAELVSRSGPSVLTALLGWSLVRRSGAGRFDPHPLIRQFAANALAADSTSQETALSLHASYYAAHVDRLGRWFRGGAQQVRSLAGVADELGNVRTAWDYARRQQDQGLLEQFLPMFHLYEIRGLYQEGAENFRLSAAALPEKSTVRARCLTAQSVLLGRLGELEQSRLVVEESLSILADANETDGLTLLHLGVVEYLEGDVERASTTWKRTAYQAAKVGDAWSRAGAIGNLGLVAWRLGHTATARRLLRQRFSRGNETQDRWGDSMGHMILAELELELGDLTAAADHLNQGLHLARSIAQQPMLLKGLHLQGCLALSLGDQEAAATSFSECADSARALGDEAWLATALGELTALDRSAPAAARP